MELMVFTNVRATQNLLCPTKFEGVRSCNKEIKGQKEARCVVTNDESV
jgi:hypothetical protein